jgi:hypothetical protein
MEREPLAARRSAARRAGHLAAVVVAHRAEACLAARPLAAVDHPARCLEVCPLAKDQPAV